MILVMAEKSHPVFRDFLGTAQSAEVKQPEFSATDSVRISQNSGGVAACEEEVSTRACSMHSAPGPLSGAGAGPTTLANSSDPSSEIWRHLKAGVEAHQGSKGFSYKEFEHDNGKKRDPSASRDSLRGSLHFNAEVLESSRPSKISRSKQKEDHRRGHGDPSSLSGDLHLSMQPPRPSPSGQPWIQTSVIKPDLTTGASKHVESSRPVGFNSPLPIGGRLNHVGTSGEKSSPKENAAGFSSLPQPPADEGSRTGLQGAGIAHLLNACPTKLVSVDPSTQAAAASQSKVPSRNAGSESALPSSHQIAAPATRQLTIFYGGQAHVFDDVTPDKADAILLLARSNGRSWSTTYAHRPSASNNSIASETRELERQKEKTASCRTSMNKTGSNALPTDVQSLLQGLARAGVGGIQPSHQCSHQEPNSARPSSDHKTAENLAVDASKIGGSFIRIPGSASAYTNITEKEAGCQGQQWM
ncbi:hypothetical protein O6H91_21G000400 [Diphasiastrum complanatum]|uniref:Uncharacterized protein n=6 Tax=Diphasiastrum complanatum TaxID=34168 RepID=A0ACC2AH78_DIPCM|nr:hypothetical protein O6H91_21G000400 [Diphasiastrum complanatum]KAJ7516827.1 hypothetical protein O6H91_21G000400 [Diphasiastrum complanatum]KAJ7516828.1 hypothetical protein O6H91_21G000400 [Diphasiastrum complanatum]KAJ7516829.1 hypothetical protein O6H91_21G000400 [Diphasiastrum complanatum]KAJ7516830.1 hypothetical protein O6H91_21G000400 [Diphasiastrum complanatum]